MPNGMWLAHKVEKPMSLLKLAEDGQEMVTLMGHLGRDPEIKYLPSGIAVCNGSLAVSWGKRTDPDQHTEWCNYVVWREDAELMAEFKKGDAILMVGKLGIKKWTNREGVEQANGELSAWTIARPIWKKRGESALVPKTPPSPQPNVDLPEDDIPF